MPSMVEPGYSRSARIVLLCDSCGKCYIKTRSTLQNSKSGKRFCTRQCKDQSQGLEGNCPEIRPSHYGTGCGLDGYRKKALGSSIECCGCGLDKLYLLLVHHIDGNRKNNELSNLEVVCGTCHMKRHLVLKNGCWKFSTNVLTDRSLLDQF